MMDNIEEEEEHLLGSSIVFYILNFSTPHE